MSALRFNHVFAGLIFIRALSAFVINPKYTNRIRNFQGLFTPVASPVRHFAAAINDRLGKPEEHDHRPLAVVRAENQELRVTLMGVMGQLEELERVNAERAKLGPLRPLCTPVRVLATDSGTSDSLALAGASGNAIMQGMAVVYSQGLVGRIDRVGIGGSQVQLVTDRSFRVTAHFQYWEKQKDGRLLPKRRDTSLAVVQGEGKGALAVQTMTAKEAERVQIGDEVVLDDSSWPRAVQSQRLGQVVSKTVRRDAPQFCKIRIKPMRDLKELQEVQVLTKVTPTVD
jgi:cell shape-determining protein MreC